MKGLDLRKFKKISEDQKCATFQHKDGHQIKIAVSALTPEMKKDLSSLPIHAAGGADTEAKASAQDTTPIQTDTPYDYSKDLPPSQGVPSSIAATPAQTAQQETPPTDVTQQTSTQPLDEDQSDQDQTQPDVDQAQPQAPQQPSSVPPAQMGPKSAAQLLQEYQSIHSDVMNGHINPLTYHQLLWQEQQPDGTWKDKGTLGKIGTLFGLALSGMGSGLAHQPNQLMQMMDNTIARNVDAQIHDKTNGQNMYKMLLNQQLNEADVAAKQAGIKLTESQVKVNEKLAQLHAATMTKMLSTSDAFNQIAKQSANNPQAQQALGIMYPMMQNELMTKASQAAGQGAFLNNLMGGTSLQTQQPEQQWQQQNKAKAMAGPVGQTLSKYEGERHIPNYPGAASNAVSQSDSDQLNAGTHFRKQLDSFIDWTKSHSGSLSPSDMNRGQALAADLQGSYRQATNGGVFKAGEQNFISNIIDDDPTKFFNEIRTVPQLEAVRDDLNRKMDVFTQNKLGLPKFSDVMGGGQGKATGNAQPKGNEIKIQMPNGKTRYFDSKTKAFLREG